MKISRTKIRFNKQIMRNAFPSGAMDGALFIHMTDMPWSEVIDDEVVLDNMYFDSHSGDKFCSNMVYRWMDSNGVVTTLGENALAISLRTRFISKWQHLWDAYVAKYNLDRDWYTHEEYVEDDTYTYGKKRDLKNVRSSLDTEKNSSTNSYDDSRVEDNSETRDDTRIDNLNHNETNQNNVFGFNTQLDNGVPSDKLTASASDTGTQQNTGATLNSTVGTDSGVSSTNSDRTNERAESTEDNEVYSGSDLRDKGGQTDSYGLRAHSIQELLAAEKTLWMWDYFRDVFNDIDSMLCLKIYAPSVIRRDYEYKEVR